MSETFMLFILILGFGCIRVVLEIVHTYLKLRWKKHLVDYKIADEVIKIYRKHKEQEKKKSWERRIKSLWSEYWAARKQRKKDREEYGIG